MTRSSLARRILLVVAVAVLSALILAALVFGMWVDMRFEHIKGDNLLPKAHALADMAQQRSRRSTLTEMADLIFSSDRAALLAVVDSNILVYDRTGALLGSDIQAELSQDFMLPLIQAALSGEDVVKAGAVVTSGHKGIAVGCPVYAYDGSLLGCVFLCESRNSYFESIRRYASLLPATLLLILPIVLLTAYMLVSFVVRPIRQMTEVANTIAAGNFTVQADESVPGETGQLAHALNYLNQMLSAKFAEVTLERDRMIRSVDSLAEGFLSLGVAGNIRYYNQTLTGMFPGRKETENERLSLVPDPAVWAVLNEALKTQTHIVHLMKWQDRVYQVTISHISQGGAVALFHDITENERLEKTRREYVANVSHELRAPLTAIRALMEPLRDGMVASEAARNRYYDIMLGEIGRLTHMIEELMELSRLQSGQTRIELAPVSIGPFLRGLSTKYRVLAQEKEQRFELELVDDYPPVLANDEKLAEVVVILLDNAMKYTPAGGVVRLGARVKGQRVEVFVRDNGVGISAADLPYVFDRFFKVDKAHTGNGSGLGLSIAKEILAQMGEEIKVISALGEGSEFYFTLRRCDEAAESHSPDTAST